MHTWTTLSALLLTTALCAGTPPDGPSSGITGFIANKGQVLDANGRSDASVRYLFQGNGLNVRLRPGGFSYDVWELRPDAATATDGAGTQHAAPPTGTFISHRIDIAFEGASTACRMEASEPFSDHLNYYTAGLPAEGATMVRHYATVTYHELYPHIDAVFHLATEDGRNGVKYDLIVRPGGDLADIRMRYTGAPASLTGGGLLALETSLGTVEERMPESWHVQGKQRIGARVRTVALGDGTFGFRCDADPRTPGDATLVIDPVPTLLWEAAFGKPELETYLAVAYDASGYAYAAGYVMSSLTGSTEAIVNKYDVGGQLLWTLYFGGSGSDICNDIAVNASGDIVIGGSTTSTSAIASVGAWQTTIGGGQDGFLARFTANGAGVWATYYGGIGTDEVTAVACDAMDRTVITGATRSAAGIASAGAADPIYSGGDDAFVTRFSAAGARQWGTYLGGTGDDAGRGIATDDGNVIAVCGVTASTSGISTPGSFLAAAPAGTNAFLTTYHAGTGTKSWSTYYGGSANDEGAAVVLENGTNNIHFCGRTKSTTGIATPGADQIALSGTEDAFLARFNATGARFWGTYIGGTGIESAIDLCITPNDRLHVLGGTTSTNGIASANALYTAPSGGFLMRYTTAGTRAWGTYLPNGWAVGGCASRDFSSTIGGITLRYTNVLVGGYVATPTGIPDAHLACLRESQFGLLGSAIMPALPIEAHYQDDGTIRVKSLAGPPEEHGTVAVYDAQGRLVHEQYWPDLREPLLLDPGDRPSGIHVIHVITDTRAFSTKVFLQP